MMTHFDPAALVRPHICQMPAYEPILPFEVLSQQLGRTPAEIVKLDANENPYGLLPAVRQALAEMPYGHIYPDPGSQELRAALAAYHRIAAENLLAGSGADELIDLLLRLLIEPGDAILNCPPTFGMYRFDGDLNTAQVVEIPRLPDFSLDLDAIEAAVARHHPKLLFLASPNNPDGSLVPRPHLERLLQLPLLLALDEAYIEFAPPGSSLLGEVPLRSNLVVLRTFSKWAGLAGLRLGYGAFPTTLMPYLWKIKQPYNVSVAAATAAFVSLQHATELQATGDKLIAERQRLFGLLQTIPYLQTYPSQANFILCRCLLPSSSGRVAGGEGWLLKHWLATQGVLVRYFKKPGLEDCIRISVGLPEHSDHLIDLLKRYPDEKCND